MQKASLPYDMNGKQSNTRQIILLAQIRFIFVDSQTQFLCFNKAAYETRVLAIVYGESRWNY